MGLRSKLASPSGSRGGVNALKEANTKTPIVVRPLIPRNRKRSAVDEVINTIKEQILAGVLHPGDRLPNEMELAQGLSISRGPVREAMKILAAFGIIEIRRGDGTYVASAINKVAFDPLLFSLILTKAEAREMVEFREAMELDIIELIVKNAGEPEIERLGAICDEMETYIGLGSYDAMRLADYDRAFHAAMGLATKNRLMEKIYDFVLDFFAPYMKRMHMDLASSRDALRIHRNIVEALKVKDLARAIEAMKESINQWRDLYANT